MPGSERREQAGEKPTKSKSSKAKDLSHVPCKFFKVGSCTAGSSCPFSHHVQEPGQQKDVCAWFVKGNCKFGHKCALAHILPGQAMAMDKKNKKAAQIAAGTTATGNIRDANTKPAKGAQRRDAPPNDSSGPQLLSGSTAPTRVLPASARPPMTVPLKASISPSVPAPPLQNTEFPSFDLSDDAENLPASERKPSSSPPPPTPSKEPQHAHDPQDIPHSSSPPPLPMSTPRRVAIPQHRSSNSTDLGPIGSPPRGSPGRTMRVNGFSPGTSPPQAAGFTSTSPFSAPGTQSVFLSYERTDGGQTDFKARSGLAASLGANRNWNAEFVQPPSAHSANGPDGKLLGSMMLGGEIAVEDEELEEFIPSSLTDLLTPEERSRRMSRTNVIGGATIKAMRDHSARSNLEGAHHRYSRSVPAPSLLSDIRSIWLNSDSPDSGMGASPARPSGVPSGLGGTPSQSFKSGSAFGGRSFGDETHTTSLLSPSNASAAFLPGLHQHYLNSKSTMLNARSVAQDLHPGPSITGTMHPNALPALNAATLSPPRVDVFSNQSLSDSRQEPYVGPAAFARAIPCGGNGLVAADADDRKNTLSPSTRALQAHAPGQSLPQGLAAGYSRIHALPPPPSIPSPGVSTGFASGQLGPSPSSNSHDWLTTESSLMGHGGGGHAGLDGMMSRLSYTPRASAALTHGQQLQPPASMARNAAGGGRWGLQGAALSPLSGPVVTVDDDLFDMDG